MAKGNVSNIIRRAIRDFIGPMIRKMMQQGELQQQVGGNVEQTFVGKIRQIFGTGLNGFIRNMTKQLVNNQTQGIILTKIEQFIDNQTSKFSNSSIGDKIGGVINNITNKMGKAFDIKGLVLGQFKELVGKVSPMLAGAELQNMLSGEFHNVIDKITSQLNIDQMVDKVLDKVKEFVEPQKQKLVGTINKFIGEKLEGLLNKTVEKLRQGNRMQTSIRSGIQKFVKKLTQKLPGPQVQAVDRELDKVLGYDTEQFVTKIEGLLKQQLHNLIIEQKLLESLAKKGETLIGDELKKLIQEQAKNLGIGDIKKFVDGEIKKLTDMLAKKLNVDQIKDFIKEKINGLFGTDLVGLGVDVIPADLDKWFNSTGFDNQTLTKIKHIVVDKLKKLAIENIKKFVATLLPDVIKAVEGVIKGVIDKFTDIQQIIGNALRGLFGDTLTQLIGSQAKVLVGTLLEVLTEDPQTANSRNRTGVWGQGGGGWEFQKLNGDNLAIFENWKFL